MTNVDIDLHKSIVDNDIHLSGKKTNDNPNQNFDSFIVEFKESRENVLNILKIVIEQGRIEPFLAFLQEKDKLNKTQMKEFIKSKYYEFVESIDNIKECKTVIKLTDEVLQNLENSIQDFLKDFNSNFITRIKKKESLKNMIKEKEKLNTAYIFFAYLNKADLAIKEQQFELAIRLMKTASEKFLKKFPYSSSVYKKGELVLQKLKNKITKFLQQKLSQWLTDANSEQKVIGESLYKKIKSETEKKTKNSSFSSSSALNNQSSSRTTKNIVDSLLLIRNTSNLNYAVNKNSVLKSSLLSTAGDINEEVEFDIVLLVSNIDIKFLEQAYNIFKSVDNDIKYIDYFRSFRQSQIHSLIKIDKGEEVNVVSLYDNFFKDILGFIIIQVAVYELCPFFYTKRKFEETMSFLVKELVSILSYEFDTFTKTTEFITLERSVFIFVAAIERIGISEKIGVDIKAMIIEMTKEKVMSLNITLISKYNTMFTRMILDDLNSMALVANTADDFIKLATQYSISLEENTPMIYPLKLPYTQFVINVNENFKRYVNEIFEFIQPLYTDYDGIIPEMVRDFLKKLNEVFILFANSQEQDINVISLAQISNNIKYILQSHVFYVEYVKKKCGIKTYVTLYSERPLKEAWMSYEEMIYEQLKKMIRRFLSDLTGDNWLPTKPRGEASSYIEGMIAYLNVIYMNLQTLSGYYVESCFKDALKFPSKLYCEILFDETVVKNYNIYAIVNLKSDVDALDSYFREIDLTYKDFSNVLEPIKNLIDFFEIKKLDVFSEKNKAIDSFYQVNEAEFIKFLTKYKNLKSSKEMKGKITESEISSLIKKYKKK